jgi:DNA-nicking Smr family endonuclease
MSDRSKRRGLSAQDETLWHGYTRSIRPLRRRPASAATDITPSPVRPKAGKSRLAGTDVAVPTASAAKPRTPAPVEGPTLAPLGRRQRQRLGRGSLEIDRRIDLHGKTQSEAHGALLRFLRAAQRDGARYVLVITGKGTRAVDEWSARGVLKRQVPLWLAQPEFRAIVVGFEDAHIGHGGEGALYVQVRRAR